MGFLDSFVNGFSKGFLNASNVPEACKYFFKVAFGIAVCDGVVSQEELEAINSLIPQMKIFNGVSSSTISKAFDVARQEVLESVKNNTYVEELQISIQRAVTYFDEPIQLVGAMGRLITSDGVLTGVEEKLLQLVAKHSNCHPDVYKKFLEELKKNC